MPVSGLRASAMGILRIALSYSTMTRHAMLPVGSMRAGRVRRLGSESHFVGQPQVESS